MAADTPPQPEDDKTYPQVIFSGPKEDLDKLVKETAENLGVDPKAGKIKS
ncbi:hypothetical protein BJY14_007183 [Actinomadura luteofluorescens]|uniref:Uncharacterized protein n=2 Tax=Actinomadura luteofluorescens TaxID=46163 RepID=A0A7Y9EQC5_9ACTN|nr:hypothetical protein [Actinomadura luteofluorescens]NYD51200.1 hypothetical protein [Actinomadura luteofluorescens]